MNRGIRLFLALLLSASVFSISAAAADTACTEHRFDGGVVTTEPTCTTIGILTYTCLNDGCGFTYTEKIGNLGHNFVDGVCTRCGAREEGVQPPAESAAAGTAPEETEAPTTAAAAGAAAVGYSIVRPTEAAAAPAETSPVSYGAAAGGARTGDPGFLPALLLLGGSLCGALLLRRRAA